MSVKMALYVCNVYQRALILGSNSGFLLSNNFCEFKTYTLTNSKCYFVIKTFLNFNLKISYIQKEIRPRILNHK